MKIYFKQRIFKVNNKTFKSHGINILTKNSVLRLSYDLNFKLKPSYTKAKHKEFLGIDMFWLFFQITFIKKYVQFKTNLE